MWEIWGFVFNSFQRFPVPSETLHSLPLLLNMPLCIYFFSLDILKCAGDLLYWIIRGRLSIKQVAVYFLCESSWLPSSDWKPAEQVGGQILPGCILVCFLLNSPSLSPKEGHPHVNSLAWVYCKSRSGCASDRFSEEIAFLCLWHKPGLFVSFAIWGLIWLSVSHFL